jgi:hypothetical protein
VKSFGAVVFAAFVLSLGCSKKEDVIVATADQVNVTAADIDQDPLALLPGGAIGIVRVDAPTLFQSQFGQRLLSIVGSRIPVPASAGFDPARDLKTLYIGMYSMQGVDVAIVATGNFHPEAIERAADGTTVTPLGAPLVKTTYAKRTLYVSRNVGFSVLTEHTVLLGDETGIRRSLDRLTEGRAKHDVPKAMDNVLSTPNAAIAGAFDFAAQPLAGAVVQQLPFLRGLKTARVLGNFQPPGLNLAGTLSYPDADAAKAGAQSFLQVNQMLRSYSFLMQLVGIGNPIQNLQAQPEGNDTQFVVSIDSRAIDWVLNQVANELGVARQSGSGTSSPVMLTPGVR